ncbi:MAG: DUF4432 family protein [Chloroflexota bacterium]
MHYEGERTHGCRVSDAWTFRGMRTVVMENETVRAIILADKGADIYSFVHKPSDTEFMWRTPWGVRDTRRFVPTSGAPQHNWLDVYEGGWQTVMPHGGYPSTVAGAEYGLHGELNTIPWDAEVFEDSANRVSVRFRARGYRSPFFVTKTLSMESGSPVLTVDESATNEAEESADAVWLEHVAIGPPFLSEKCRLFVPPETRLITHPTDTSPSSKIQPGWEGQWPNVPSKAGGTIDFSRMPPKADRSLDQAYLNGMSEGWYALTNEETGVGFGLQFPTDPFQYLWFWRNLGGGWGYPWYGRCYNVGLEPCTSLGNTGLVNAQQNGSARRFEAGETVSATIRAIAYTGTQPVSRIDSAGIVHRG